MTPSQKEVLEANRKVYTSEEARYYGSKGGKQSALKRNARGYIQDLTVKLLTECKPNEQGERFYQRNGLSSKRSKDALEGIIKGNIVKAQKGDPAATKLIMELLGCAMNENTEASSSEEIGGVIEIPSISDEGEGDQR